MTREEALVKVRGYLTDLLPIEDYDEVEEIMFPLEQQPCEDCISRAEALYRIELRRKITCESDPYNYEEWTKGYEEGIDDAIAMIDSVPSVTPKYTDEEIDRAQVVEQAYIDKMVELTVEKLKRPKGKWIACDVVRFGDFVGAEKYECSNCHHRVGIFKSNFCPNCGARMTESEDKE